MADLRFALRQLRKSPGFTLVAVITLALGIGANTAIFSVIYAVLLKPLPYPAAERIVILTESDNNQPSISVSFPDYLDWKRDNTVFEQLAVARRESYNLSGLPHQAPEQISGAIVTANFFKVVGLAPQLGRTFTEEEDRVGGPLLAVISDKLWQRAFQRDPAVLGRAVNFGNQPFTVIGEMPPQMFSPRTVDVWFPLMRRTDNAGWQMRDNHPGLYGWGRLKPGVSLEKAHAEMAAIAQRLAAQHPDTNSKIGVTTARLLENQVGDYRSSLILLLGAVALVLLIACVNLANLLAARGAARAREFAVRAPVGASRWQIVRQLLIESLVLALCGGIAGIFIATWSCDLLVRLAPAGVPRFQNIAIDGWVLAFTLGVSLLTSVLFGLWPALHMSRADIQLALKAGGHGSSDAPAAKRSRDLLVIAEVALTLILLTASALVLQSFANARALPLGFQPGGLLTARIDLPEPAYSDEKKALSFSNALLEKLSALPGVEHAALAANPPLMTGWQTSFLPEGDAEPPPGQLPSVETSVITEDYLRALETPLLRGRMFDRRDDADAERVVIIDQMLADRYFPGHDPVGKRVRMNVSEKRGRELYTIVGVIPHLKVYGFDETNSLPQGYLPFRQQPQTGIVVLLRTGLTPKSLEQSVRQIVAGLDPSQPAFEFRTMQDRVEETWATPRLLSFLLTVFAGLALTLAIIGIYGVMAYNGLRRTREIGLRLALGAQRFQVVNMMLRQGSLLLAVAAAFACWIPA
ncbi:MAG: ABC transporter permease, partial [Verrucomicrobiota bacterium]|nr:ABC transporter permease [Verrucomicrobiota bacterium]